MLCKPAILSQLAILAGLVALGLVSSPLSDAGELEKGASKGAGELILNLSNGRGITFVGAIQRWDDDGNPRKPVDPKAKIGAPQVTAEAKRRESQSWGFAKLPPGRYDLVILKNDRIRVEGFHYPPIFEFDPFFPSTGKEPEEEARQWIFKDIARGQHYENKVEPLCLAGDQKQVRVLVQLVRDQPTSYDAEAGFPVATIRHEIWQYTYRYGGWSKERSTKILDRILLPRAELHRWTWVWEARLGGIEVQGGKTVRISYSLPDQFDPRAARGWFPD